VEALFARGTGVDVEHVVEGRHPLHLEDVAVPAHQHVGRGGLQLRAHSVLPAPGPAGDVGHPHVEPGHREPFVLGEPTAKGGIVDVAPDGRDRGHRLQPVQNGGVAHVPGVQNAVHARQVVRQVGMEVAVGVRDNAERGHATV